MKLLNFKSQNLEVAWISFNIQGLPDQGTIASSFSKHFTPHVKCFVVASAVGQTLDPSISVKPISELGAAYQYIHMAKTVAETHKRVAIVGVLLGSSTAVLETDLATNGAMAALHVAFNAYMQSVIETGNGGNIPFLLPYKAGQLLELF